MRTTLVAALVAILLLPVGSAAARQPQQLRVVVVEALTLADLSQLATRGAIGLLVPAAGPTTSGEQALASLVRGRGHNTLLGGDPTGRELIRVERSRQVPAGAGFVVLALPANGERRNDRRYPIAVVARGFRGQLRSRSTRIDGLVSIVDVAPTALGGTASGELAPALSSRPQRSPWTALAALERRIAGHNTARLPAALLAAAGVLLLLLVRPLAGVLGFVAGLTTNLILGLAGVSDAKTMVIAVALGTLAGGLALSAVVREPEQLVIPCTAVLVAYFGALLAGEAGVALSPFGPSQSGRFWGISNLLETMLLVPALVAAAAALLRRRWLLPLIAVLALVTVGAPGLGADAGGILVLVAGLGALLALSDHSRIAPAAGILIAATLVLALAAERLSPEGHLARSLSGGLDGFAADLRDRIELSFARLASGPAPALATALALIALCLLTVRLLRSPASRATKALPLALALAVAVSLVVNDSPQDVSLVGLVGFLAVSRCTIPGRCDASSRSLLPRSRSPSA